MAGRKIQGRVLNSKEVKIAMIRQELTTEHLSKALSLSKISVNARLNGKTPCRILELEKLSDILKVPLDQLALPEEPTNTR